MNKLMGFTKSAFDPASRFRFVQFIPHFRKSGLTVIHRPNRPDVLWESRLPTRMLRALHNRAGRLAMKANRFVDIRDARDCGVVFVNRDLAGGGLFFEKRLKKTNPRIVFDFDDAIFIGRNEPAIQWMCANSAWVTPGNEYLATYARQFSDRVTIIPTVIDTDTYVPRSYPESAPSKHVRVGWSGSDQSIHSTLIPRLGMLARLQTVVDFELVIITNTKPQLPVSKLRWTFIPWNESEESSMANKFDIGIMPLEETEFMRGKCGLKLLQYMAAGLPTIASPVGVNKTIVQHGVTGMSATTETEWQVALESLVRNAGMRASMGQAGRRFCEEQYSIRRWLPTLVGIFEHVWKTGS